MNLKYYFADRNRIFLAVILLSGFILRFYHLNFQSYWVDELHTMREADPSISWGEMINYLKCCDPHPPLYFFICRMFFTVFGHTEYVGRLVSVLIGSASVWAMYFLGKQIYSRQLGLLAAAFTSINYFHIYYSQETRNYILLFLTATLSLAFFFRLMRSLQKRDMFWFAGATLLMLYSHYYGMFMVVAEFAVAAYFLITSPHTRSLLFKRFLIAGLIIVAGFAPWIPAIIETASGLQSFWIGPIKPDFANVYFFQYFGDNALITPFIIVLTIYYCIEVFRETPLLEKDHSVLSFSPLSLSFGILFATTFITYLLPYLRSLLSVPMLFNRYTILVLPSFLIAIAFALVRIHHPAIRGLIMLAILTLTMIDFGLVRHYYTTPAKTEFRKVSKFIIDGSRREKVDYPIINQLTSWQQAYYLQRANYKGEVWTGKKEDMIDSILQRKSPKYEVDGFWLVGFHGDPQPAADKLQALDTAFVKIQETSGTDAWAMLYISNKANSASKVISPSSYDPKLMTEISGVRVIPVWGGAVPSLPQHLLGGNYELLITSRGTPFEKTFPHLKVYLNNTLIDQFYTQEEFDVHKSTLKVPSDGDYILKIELDNDASAPGLGDRNAFIRMIQLNKQ